LVAERFRQEFDGAGFHCPYARRDVAMSGDENNWSRRIRLGQFLLQVKTADAGQAHIEHQAMGALPVRACQELWRRGKRLCVEPRRAEKISQAFTDGRII